MEIVISGVCKDISLIMNLDLMNMGKFSGKIIRKSFT